MIRANESQVQSLRTFLLNVSIAASLAGFMISPALAQSSGTWALTGSLNVARSAHTATLLDDGWVLVVGGEDSSSKFLTSAELYDPSRGTWVVTGNTATPRIQHTATLLSDGEVLVAGGYLGVDSSYRPIYTDTAEIFNPATGQWTPTGSMTMPRGSAGAALLPNGQVLVAGGTNYEGTAGDTAELYDPALGVWKATGNLHNAHLLALTRLQDGRVLKADASGSTGSFGEIYDPATGQWTVTATMYYSHTGDSTALLQNGDVLVYGNKFACYAAEYYNPSANTWSRTNGQCNTGISFGPLVLLGSGKALLGGGAVIYSGKSSPSSNSSLYDPSTNSWTNTGSLMNQRRRSHTLTLLSDGRALAAGGVTINSSGVAYTTATAEIYTP